MCRRFFSFPISIYNICVPKKTKLQNRHFQTKYTLLHNTKYKTYRNEDEKKIAAGFLGHRPIFDFKRKF